MSRDRRDQRGGHRLRHPPMQDCLCCEVLTPRDREPARGTQVRRAIAEQPPVPADFDSLDPAEAQRETHAYHLGRCVRCGIDWIDGDLPGYEFCAPKTSDVPISFTSRTGADPVSSHEAFLD